MIKIVSTAAMREIEAAADVSGVTYERMMQNAGAATAQRALELLNGLPEVSVTILIGPGNNGGDGLVAGRILAEQKHIHVGFYLVKKRAAEDPNFTAIVDAGLAVVYATDDKDGRALREMVNASHLILDALFGVGIRLPLKGNAARILRTVREELAASVDSEHTRLTLPTQPGRTVHQARAYVLAVDCPSGLDCDSGEIDENALRADETVSFIAAKPGLLRFPGAEFVGRLSVSPIGVPADIENLEDKASVLVAGALVRNLLPDRALSAHKGTFGKVLIVGGSTNYVGAVGLAAEAAYRTGVGLVTVGAPQGVVTALAGRLAEPTWMMLPQDMGVISERAVGVVAKEIGDYGAGVFGPGWGDEDTTGRFFRNILERAEHSRAEGSRQIGFGVLPSGARKSTAQDEVANGSQLPPLVIDADGLNLLSKIDNWWTLLPRDTILTPHPGEMARLAGIDSNAVQEQRWELATKKAQEWGVVLVLKGAHTVITGPDGQFALLPFKTDALATAGTGDILAGAIGGLVAQGLTAFEAAVVGGYLHGLAGEQAALRNGNSRSVIASDVLQQIPAAISMVEAC